MCKHKKLITAILILCSFSISSAALCDALRDPTRPPTGEESFPTTISLNDLRISAIFSGKDHNSAIIGSKIFRVGDKIADAVITAIDKDGVTLKNEDGGESKVNIPYLTIKSPTIKSEKKNRENSD